MTPAVKRSEAPWRFQLRVRSSGGHARAIEALPHDPDRLIAHRLGGLDARHALAHLGLDRRVRSLVTIGAPYRGTSIAVVVLGGPSGR